MQIPGLLHGKEKSGKTKKNDKSQKKLFLKHQISSVQIYKIPYTLKPLIGKN